MPCVWCVCLCFRQLLATKGILFSGCPCPHVCECVRLCVIILKSLQEFHHNYNFGIKLGWLDFEVRRSKVKVIMRPNKVKKLAVEHDTLKTACENFTKLQLQCS